MITSSTSHFHCKLHKKARVRTADFESKLIDIQYTTKRSTLFICNVLVFTVQFSILKEEFFLIETHRLTRFTQSKKS